MAHSPWTLLLAGADITNQSNKTATRSFRLVCAAKVYPAMPG